MEEKLQEGGFWRESFDQRRSRIRNDISISGTAGDGCRETTGGGPGLAVEEEED